MKKKLVGFAALLLLVLSSCGGSKELNPLNEMNSPLRTDSPIKIVTEKETYTQEDTVIRYTISYTGENGGWINSDDQCFTLLKQVDGEWMYLGTKIEHMWTEAAMSLWPEDPEEREIDLETYYHLPLSEGTYCIAVEGDLSNTFEIVE